MAVGLATVLIALLQPGVSAVPASEETDIIWSELAWSGDARAYGTYRPPGTEEGAPAVVLLHGGGAARSAHGPRNMADRGRRLPMRTDSSGFFLRGAPTLPTRKATTGTTAGRTW